MHIDLKGSKVSNKTLGYQIPNTNNRTNNNKNISMKETARLKCWVDSEIEINKF